MILLSHFLHGEGIESIEFQPPKKSPPIPNKKHRGHAWSVQACPTWTRTRGVRGC